MINKYLGIIEDLDFQSLSLADKNKYLYDNEWYVVTCSSKVDLLDSSEDLGKKSILFEFSEEYKNFIPSIDVRNEFYDYIKHKYSAALRYTPVMFKKEFSAKTFGIKSKDKLRSFALEEFNHIFKNCASPTYHLWENRFYALSYNRKYYISKLGRERSLVEAYLLGIEDVFDRSLYENSQLLIDILDFEGHLEVLISLNKEYDFQVDNCFTPKASYLLFHEKMDPKFNVNVSKFIDSYVLEITEKQHSYLSVLYRFLKDQLLLDFNEEEFRLSLNSVYGISVGRLKRSDSNNLEFDKRLDKCVKNWEDFNKKED